MALDVSVAACMAKLSGSIIFGDVSYHRPLWPPCLDLKRHCSASNNTCQKRSRTSCDKPRCRLVRHRLARWHPLLQWEAWLHVLLSFHCQMLAFKGASGNFGMSSERGCTGLACARFFVLVPPGSLVNVWMYDSILHHVASWPCGPCRVPIHTFCHLATCYT